MLLKYLWKYITYSSPVSSACDSRDSMPDRNCSNDLDIWASWAFGERLSDMALCRSSSDSLMWSDRRNSCGGLVAIVVVEVWRCGDGGGCYLSVELECCKWQARRRCGGRCNIHGSIVFITQLQHNTRQVYRGRPNRQRFRRVETGQGCSGERSADARGDHEWS
jgi:hypothetical protein